MHIIKSFRLDLGEMDFLHADDFKTSPFNFFHYPAGKLLMYVGFYATIGFLILLIIWGIYVKNKNK